MTPRIKILLFTTCISFVISTAMFSQTENTIVGKWKNEEDPSKEMQIYLAKDGFFYGKGESGKIVLKHLKYNTENKTYKVQ